MFRFLQSVFFLAIGGCHSATQIVTQKEVAAHTNATNKEAVVINSSYVIPFGPPLPRSLQSYAHGTVKWTSLTSVEVQNDVDIGRYNPRGKLRTYSMPPVLVPSTDGGQLLVPSRTLQHSEIWLTRGIRLGETRRFYPSVGLFFIRDDRSITWLHRYPHPTMEENGNPIPPMALYEPPPYIIGISEPEYSCFWKQIGYSPKGMWLALTLPDMLVIEACIKRAKFPLHEAFDLSKQTYELDKKESDFERKRNKAFYENMWRED